jgi:hypothetical protein
MYCIFDILLPSSLSSLRDEINSDPETMFPYEQLVSDSIVYCILILLLRKLLCVVVIRPLAFYTHEALKHDPETMSNIDVPFRDDGFKATFDSGTQTPTTQDIETYAKQSDREPYEVAEWFYMARCKAKIADIVATFETHVLHVLTYVMCVCIGTYVLVCTDIHWFTERTVSSRWGGYPHTPVEFEIKQYYSFMFGIQLVYCVLKRDVMMEMLSKGTLNISLENTGQLRTYANILVPFILVLSCFHLNLIRFGAIVLYTHHLYDQSAFRIIHTWWFIRHGTLRRTAVFSMPLSFALVFMRFMLFPVLGWIPTLQGVDPHIFPLALTGADSDYSALTAWIVIGGCVLVMQVLHSQEAFLVLKRMFQMSTSDPFDDTQYFHDFFHPDAVAITNTHDAMMMMMHDDMSDDDMSDDDVELVWSSDDESDYSEGESDSESDSESDDGDGVFVDEDVIDQDSLSQTETESDSDSEGEMEAADGEADSEAEEEEVLEE